MATQPKKMTVKDFRAQGYLQELNRQFLHPLGLAMEVVLDDETGEERFGGVWDLRDRPEGFIFADGVIDAEKAERIVGERVKKNMTRREVLGFDVQPSTKPDDAA